MHDQYVWIEYTNHRGERRWRHVGPGHIVFSRTEWHPERQWLLRAFDVEKAAWRHFTMADIHAWCTTKPDGEP